MKDITVVIAEDDLYSCDLMAFLLSRDRRVQVVAEGLPAVFSLEEEDPALTEANVILLDTELSWDDSLVPKLLRRPRRGTKLVCTATMVNDATLREILAGGGNGYVLKDEVHYALGEAIVLAAEGTWVTTPSVAQHAKNAGISLPGGYVIVDGAHRMHRLSGRHLAIARLCILFDQSYKDVADELGLNASYIGDLVAGLYEELGLNAILDGEVPPEEYFDDPEVLGLFHRAIERRRKNPKAHGDMKTLAFHLLTLPELEKGSR